MQLKTTLDIDSNNHKRPINPSRGFAETLSALHRMRLAKKFDVEELIYNSYDITNIYELNYILHIIGSYGEKISTHKRKNKRDYGELEEYRCFIAHKRQMVISTLEVEKILDKYLEWRTTENDGYVNALNADGDGKKGE